MPEIKILLHNIRSIHNVGSILRTAEGLGVSEVIFSGYTPYPKQPIDTRLPHIIEKIEKTLHKTALGAEKLVKNKQIDNLFDFINQAKNDGYLITALEQNNKSQNIKNYQATQKMVLILGEEVAGIEPEIIAVSDLILEIPMVGKKESFNVSVATGIALFWLTNL